MTKLYKVYLETQDKAFFESPENIEETDIVPKEFFIICRRFSLSKFVFQDIITNRLVYPLRKNKTDKLTYGYLQNGIPRCYEMEETEILEWFNNLNEEKVKRYINKLNEIEKEIIENNRRQNQEQQTVRDSGKNINKSIRRTLRKIKTKSSS